MTFVWTNRAALNMAAAGFVDEAALFIMDQAKAIAPVDTGNLANSIQADLTNPLDPTPEARVYTGVEYAVYQEFGTRFMQAQPFFGPALAAARAVYG